MDTTNWKWFSYETLFIIKKGKRLTKSDMEDGNIPYIGAIDSNNGLSAKIGNDKHLHDGNTISVSYNGSIGYAYYQETAFWATDDVNVLYPKFTLTKYIALFLCSLIEQEQYRYCYGRKWDLETMKQTKILLPAISDTEPDWQYMENFVKNTIIPSMPSQAKAIWEKSYDKEPIQSQTLSLDTSKWQWFRLGDYLSAIYKANAYNFIELQECLPNHKDAIPYITRKDTNNGCRGYVINDGFNQIEKENAITIGDTTSTIDYQAKDFICGDHIVVLRSSYFNKYTALFIVTLLKRERYRYNYGRAFLKDTIANTRLQLPAIQNLDGTYSPDWQFMEDYIKSLPYSKNI